MSASSPDSGPYPEAAGHARMMPLTSDKSDKAPHLSGSTPLSVVSGFAVLRSGEYAT
jgi:hypothetical protein